jgi:hypothetical protein
MNEQTKGNLSLRDWMLKEQFLKRSLQIYETFLIILEKIEDTKLSLFYDRNIEKAMTASARPTDFEDEKKWDTYIEFLCKQLSQLQETLFELNIERSQEQLLVQRYLFPLKFNPTQKRN